MSKSLLFCVLFVLYCATGLYAQITARDIRGVVQDSVGKPLVGVTVRLYAAHDTLMTSTNENGRFVLSKVSERNFSVSFYLFGFQIYEQQYREENVLPINQTFTINLKTQPIALQEVAVFGVVPMRLKQDTIEYDVRAFSVQKNALLEDLIKQLPGGIDVRRNGEIYAQGQLVNRVKVNNRYFFNGDVLTATRNLPADVIKKIQFIDDYGDQSNLSGIKSGKAEKVLNIILKDETNGGSFGQATVGGGTQNRYLGNIAYNKFTGDQQFSVLGSSNNTNTNLFTFGDISGGGGRNSSDFNTIIDDGDGLNAAYSGNINYGDQIGKVNLHGSYTFTRNFNSTKSISGVESLYDYGRNITTDTVLSTSALNRHELNWSAEVNIDSANYLKISPSFTFTTRITDSKSLSNINYQNLLTERKYNTRNSGDAPDVGMDVLYNHKFKKQGRNLSINTQIKYANDEQNNKINDLSKTFNLFPFRELSASQDSLSQRITDHNINQNAMINVFYTEPLTKKTSLEFRYDFNATSIGSTRKTFNYDKVEQTEKYIDSLSIDYAYLFLSHEVGINYHWKGKKINYTLGLAVQPTNLIGSASSQNIYTENSAVNFIPRARFQYEIDRETNLTFSYVGQNNQPGFLQILPIRDVSNPQFIVNGNSDLEAEFSHTVSFEYRKLSLHRGSSFFMNGSYTNVQNKVVTNRVSDRNSTVQETFYLNANGYFGLRGYYDYTTPLSGEVLSLNLNGNINYINNVSYINMIRNLSRNALFEQSLKLSLQIEDYVDADLGGTYSLNNIVYPLQLLENYRVQTYSFGFGGRGYFTKDWSLGCNLSKQYNQGFHSVSNANPTILNVYLEKTFLKNRLGSLRLQCFDLFNQNIGINREINGNTVMDVQSNRLARYFLLTLKIRFNKFSHNEEASSKH